MDKPMHACLRMGLVHFMAFPELGGGRGPWEETVRAVALDPFFTALEITRILDDQVRERVRDILCLADLAVGFGAHPVILGGKLDLNAADEAERRAVVATMKGLIEEALYMGAESFVVLSGKDPGDEARPAAVDALVKSLGELCAYSASLGGPKVVAEVFDREVDKCCLLGPAALAAEVAARVSVDHGNFGLLVDLSHIPLLGESPDQALVPVKQWLAAAHLGNAVLDRNCGGHGDNHPIFGSPGSVNGLSEMVAFLRSLDAIGFLEPARRPMVSFEVKPLPGQDPLLVIANAKRMMNLAWALA
jgi:sugar phosphate isomerase/epimerase